MTRYARLEKAIAWYDRKASRAQFIYKTGRIVQIAVTTGIPILGGVLDKAHWAAGLGALALMIEAIQQLNQSQQNWITYRATCEALKQERALFLGGGGPYGPRAPDQTKRRLLVERVENIMNHETVGWMSRIQKARKRHA